MNMHESEIGILIVGAGPAGLATAGRLRKEGIDFEIWERSGSVGNSWRHHYDRLHLHTIKKWSNLPHLKFPDSYPTYASRQQVVDYLEDYAREFEIKPKLGVEVKKITRDGAAWRVEADGVAVIARNVVVATGVNRIPNIPHWSGTEQFGGEILHSIDYRNPKPFAGSRALVVGMGNTGAEIALDLSESGVKTFLSVRGSVNIVPRDLNGRPVQQTARLLSKLPFGIGDWLGSLVQGVFFGDLSKYGLRRSKVKPSVQIRETAKTPVIDVGTVDAIKSGKITVVGGIERFDRNGVILEGGESLAIDHVILATGYKPGLHGIIDSIKEFEDGLGYPKGPVGEGYHEGLYFVGFNNYELGGILGTIYRESKEVVDHLLKKVRGNQMVA